MCHMYAAKVTAMKTFLSRPTEEAPVAMDWRIKPDLKTITDDSKINTGSRNIASETESQFSAEISTLNGRRANYELATLDWAKEIS